MNRLYLMVILMLLVIGGFYFYLLGLMHLEPLYITGPAFFVAVIFLIKVLTSPKQTKK